MLYCDSIKIFHQKLLEATPILGIDYGSKKIGISISDKNRVVAMPHSVVKSWNFSEIYRIIDSLIKEKNISGLIIGYPIEPSGDIGQSCKNVEKFMHKLCELGLKTPYYYQDERLSTKAAVKFLYSGFASNKTKKEEDDSLAASYILQTTLDLINNSL